MGNDQRPTPVNSMAPDTVDLTSLPEMVALAPHPPTLGHKKTCTRDYKAGRQQNTSTDPQPVLWKGSSFTKDGKEDLC